MYSNFIDIKKHIQFKITIEVYGYESLFYYLSTDFGFYLSFFNRQNKAKFSFLTSNEIVHTSVARALATMMGVFVD